MSKKIYIAKKIITMNPSMPTATHIAVDGNKIVTVGPEQAVAHLTDYEIDTQFADKIFTPGFVEGHAHSLNGTIWHYVYIGRFARRSPKGRITDNFDTLEKIKQRMIEADKFLPIWEPLVCWGFDHTYFDDETIDKEFLDSITTDRPIMVINTNLHKCNINTKLIQKMGLDKSNDLSSCVALDEHGRPNGELNEMEGLGMAFNALGVDLLNFANVRETYFNFAETAKHVGITTITDLFHPLSDESIDLMKEATEEPDYPIRLIPVLALLGQDPEQAIKLLKKMKKKGNDKLYYGLGKIMVDGSIQGYTGRLKQPYHDGTAENGMWNTPPELVHQMVQTYHQAGIQLHIHTNGDEAIELTIDAINDAIALWPNMDHRHTLHHCQLPSQKNLQRMAKLGICADYFINHVYYWGDVHLNKTLGYERSQRLSPLASSLKHNVATAMHSDAPATPLGPLFCVQCAVTRKTPSGVVLGENERITVQQALEMVTINPAYSLFMEDKVGSLEIGKFADIAILDDDPLETDVNKIADIKVHGTIMNGDIYVS